MAVDTLALETGVAAVSSLLRMHGGAIELVDASPEGEVRVRFLGMCTACPLQPVTVAATVRRVLMGVEGVTRVDALGVRISEQAERRLAAP
jgi:Fe-S cluster biogenesis protein NfuA